MLVKQFSKFVIIGVLSTSVNFFVFYILLNVCFCHYLLSSGVGFLSGVFAGFGFNKCWTFEVKRKEISFVGKYILTYCCSLFIGLFFLEFQVRVFQISPEIANVFSIGLTTCSNFIGSKFWVFQTR